MKQKTQASSEILANEIIETKKMLYVSIDTGGESAHKIIMQSIKKLEEDKKDISYSIIMHEHSNNKCEFILLKEGKEKSKKSEETPPVE